MEYGIFDAFPNQAALQAHLNGPVATALFGEGKRLLARDPQVEPLKILASKLPPVTAPPPVVTRGLLLTFKAKQGHEAKVDAFLRGAQNLVVDEAGTVAWCALHLDNGEFGVFDVFPDNGARFAHLTGHVPRELTKHALSLLGGLPDMQLLQVLASHFAERDSLVGLGVD
jgi:quinol monooxygenase YgiN